MKTKPTSGSELFPHRQGPCRHSRKRKSMRRKTVERDDFYDGPHDEAAIREAVKCCLLNMPFIKSAYCSPREVVTSHFVNPLRTFSAVRGFLQGYETCEVFKTHNVEDSEWCVLGPDDQEVIRARKTITEEDSQTKDCCWEYLLSQPERGEWRHGFVPVPKSITLDAEEHPKDRRLGGSGESCSVRAAPGWRPIQSGVRMLLRDVTIGRNAGECLPRPEMLLGLARHISGKGVWHKIGGGGAPVQEVPWGTEVSSLQRSSSGLIYYIYSLGNSGPTHIFTQAER